MAQSPSLSASSGSLAAAFKVADPLTPEASLSVQSNSFSWKVHGAQKPHPEQRPTCCSRPLPPSKDPHRRLSLRSWATPAISGWPPASSGSSGPGCVGLPLPDRASVPPSTAGSPQCPHFGIRGYRRNCPLAPCRPFLGRKSGSGARVSKMGSTLGSGIFLLGWPQGLSQEVSEPQELGTRHHPRSPREKGSWNKAGPPSTAVPPRPHCANPLHRQLPNTYRTVIL